MRGPPTSPPSSSGSRLPEGAYTTSFTIPHAPLIRSVPLPQVGAKQHRHASHPAFAQMHPLLEFSPSPQLRYNLVDPLCGSRRRGVGDFHLADLAFYPSLDRLFLRVSSFPAWVVTVTNTAGVTIGDVFAHTESFFQSALSPNELHSLGPAVEQAALYHALLRRKRYPDSPPICRGDVLGQRVWFYGLCRSPDGSSFDILLGDMPI